MKICILIAAYNEKKRIGSLILQIREVEGISDIIVVDDGSIDNTYEEAKKAGAIVLKHERNKGKGTALRTGFSYIKSKDYSAVITLDGDGQHKYSEIPNFIEAYKKGNADIVVGSRMLARRHTSGGIQCKDMPSSKKQAGMPFIRYAANHFTSFITSVLSRYSVSDSQSGFRLISTNALKKIELSTSNFEIESEVIIKAARKGFKIKEIPISTVYLVDSTKKSKINPFVDTLRFFRFVLKNL